MPKLWAHVNHDIYKLKTVAYTEKEANIKKKKTTRWEKVLYSLSKVHGDFNKNVNRATWLSNTQIMDIC